MELSKKDKDLIKKRLEESKKAKKGIDERIIKAKKLYEASKLGNERKGSSKVVIKVLAKMIEWILPNLTEPFLTSKRPIEVVLPHNQDGARIIKRYANNTFTSEFNRQDRTEEVVQVLLEEGTVWIQSKWREKKQTKRKTFKGSLQEVLAIEDDPVEARDLDDGTIEAKYVKEVILENHGDIEVIPNENVLTDPNASTTEDMEYLFIREELTKKEMDELIKERRDYQGEDDADMYAEDSLETSSEQSSLLNFRAGRGTDSGKNYDGVTKAVYVVYKYWGSITDSNGDEKQIIVTVSSKGDEIYKVEENYMPRQNIPFYNARYSVIPFSLWGRPLAELIEDNQRIQSGLIRGMLDNIDLSNNGHKFISPGGLSPLELRRLKNGERYIMTDRPEAIQDGSYNQIPGYLFGLLEWTDSESRELSGIQKGSPALGKGQLDGDDQTQVKTLSQQKMSSLVSKISALYSGPIKDWVSLAELLLTDEQLKILFSDEESIDVFALSLYEQAMISIDVGTEEERSKKLRDINLLLQQSKVLANELPDGHLRNLVAEFFDILNRPDDADALRHYQRPAPSPIENKMQKQELDEKDAKIQKLLAEANEVTMRSKTHVMNMQTNAIKAQAEAGLKNAQSTKAHSSAQKDQVDSALKPLQVQTEMEKAVAGDAQKVMKGDK